MCIIFKRGNDKPLRDRLSHQISLKFCLAKENKNKVLCSVRRPVRLPDNSQGIQTNSLLLFSEFEFKPNKQDVPPGRQLQLQETSEGCEWCGTKWSGI